MLEHLIIQLQPQLEVPVLAANHPSFVFNAVIQLQRGKKFSSSEQIMILGRIMQQDLIAARWQAGVSRAQNIDTALLLQQAIAFWNDPAQHKTIYELTAQQILHKKLPAITLLCSGQPAAPNASNALSNRIVHSDTNIERRIYELITQIGASDSGELPDSHTANFDVLD